jgi:hypothetical protein
MSAERDRLDPMPSEGVRFTLRYLPGLTFIRYPIEAPPPDGTMGFVNGADWQSPAKFVDGAWLTMGGKPFARKPTHWTIMDDKA